MQCVSFALAASSINLKGLNISPADQKRASEPPANKKLFACMVWKWGFRALKSTLLDSGGLKGGIKEGFHLRRNKRSRCHECRCIKRDALIYWKSSKQTAHCTAARKRRIQMRIWSSAAICRRDARLADWLGKLLSPNFPPPFIPRRWSQQRLQSLLSAFIYAAICYQLPQQANQRPACYPRLHARRVIHLAVKQ